MRCFKSQLDEGIGEKVPSEHALVAWLASHCGVLYNISSVGSDGMTPFERARGRRMGRPICMFGEKILFKPVVVGRGKTGKLEPKFEDGLFLGIVERTGEVIVGMADGTAGRCRDYKRRPAPERWDRQLALGLTALPWAPKGEDVGEKEMLPRVEKVLEPHVPEKDLPPVPTEARVARALYVTSRLIQKFGKTTPCQSAEIRVPPSLFRG